MIRRGSYKKRRGGNQMLSEHQMQLLRKYCREPIEDIKGYEEALNSTEKYHCHHINELTFTKYELVKMNMYYNRPASELVLIIELEHKHLHGRPDMPSSRGRTGELNPMYGRTGENHPASKNKGELSPMFGRTGSKHPSWKGDNVTIRQMYRRKSRGL